MQKPYSSTFLREIWVLEINTMCNKFSSNKELKFTETKGW